MNINSFSEIIDCFRSQIISSGFQRDVQDFYNSLSANQNNILALREIANKTKNSLERIASGDLTDQLEKIFVGEVKPLPSNALLSDLNNILNDSEIVQNAFFQKLKSVISELNTHIQENISEIDRIDEFIRPYLENVNIEYANNNAALISIVFKDDKTIRSLKEFSKTINSWNKIIPLYHQLLSSKSPADVEIVNVQNGSIEFVVNLDIDLSIELVKLFEIGFKCFMAYLSYKFMLSDIVKSYYGNKKLIEGEKDREKELINNIGEAIKEKLIEQHKNALAKDQKIDSNVDKKIEQITKLVTSHILKGNDLKVLSLPGKVDNDENVQDIRSISSEVRRSIKSLPKKEMLALLEKYKDPE